MQACGPDGGNATLLAHQRHEQSGSNMSRSDFLPHTHDPESEIHHGSDLDKKK